MPLTLFLTGYGSTNIFIEDDGLPGNAAARLRTTAGDIYNFGYPADTLSFVSTAGQALTFDLFDSLSAATLTVGSLTDATQDPDAIAVRKVASTAAMTMAALNTINEAGSDAAADIVATTLALRAGKGIGVGNALETQVSTLEARAETGGINIVNLTGVTIGGISDSLTGLSAGTSGNIRVEAFGTITLADTDGPEAIAGGGVSGNVTLIAHGAGANITSAVNRDAIAAAGGNIVLTADSNIQFGIGTDFDNDIRAKGSITVNAGGYFWIDGNTDVASGDFSGNSSAGITINAASGIYIQDTYGTDASLAANGEAGADITLNAGAGSSLFLLAPSSAAVLSQSGDVIANADTMTIAADSGITATKGVVTLRPTTAGLAIDLGSGSELAGRLSLSDAELDRVFAPTLAIGGAQAGGITVTNDITLANATDLVLQSSTDIVVNSGVVVSITGSLELRAGDDIALLGGGIVAAKNVVGYVDFGNTDPGTGGTAFVDSAFATAVKFIGNADSDRLFGGAAGDALDGAGGADILTGRAGDDTYFVDNLGDVINETAGDGTADRVTARASYALAADDDIEIMTTNGSSGTTAINLTGNALAQRIVGNAGANILSDGGVGAADTMSGLGGNDTYRIYNSGDVIAEGATQGAADKVSAGVDYQLGAGVHIEIMTTTSSSGTSGVDLTGNEIAQAITGNAGGNILNGRGGIDTLSGLGGKDFFVFSTALGAGNVDTITDFSVADDTIRLENAIFAALTTTGALAAAAFRANTTGLAGDASDRIIYETDTGELYYDANGNAAGGGILFAKIGIGLALTNADFVVI